MLATRYEAAMVLGGVGDALGYRNGRWEFCTDGLQIHNDLELLGGLSSIKIELPHWHVSDDTVMHLATAEALIDSAASSKKKLYATLARKYIACTDDMNGRAPGDMTIASLNAIERNNGALFWQLPFHLRAGGCGAAMRAMCIGLRYPAPAQLDELVAVSVESGRITHHHPTGYLGGLVAALFAAYAVQGKPIKEWGVALVNEVLPLAKKYVQSQKRFVAENLTAWPYFETSWKEYIELRQIGTGQNGPVFPKQYGVAERDEFYESISFSGWGGSSGHDSVIIAYDGLLGCNGNWSDLCKRATLHGGDSDSTGSIASCWFGAVYGYDSVHPCHYQDVEYRERLAHCAKKLYLLSGSNNLE